MSKGARKKFEEAVSTLKDEHELRTAKYLTILQKLIPKALGECGVPDGGTWCKHDIVLSEIAYHAAKDIQRLNVYQNDGLDPLKAAAYFAFWIRKLKPIGSAENGGKQITDINERVAVAIFTALISEITSTNKNYEETIVPRLKKFLNQDQDYNYLIDSMRHRTFGPHHFYIMARTLCAYAA